MHPRVVGLRESWRGSVGRVIRLHPLAIILSLAVGSVLAGIAGAVVAVPIVAVITRAVPELRRRDPAPGGP